MAKAKTSRQGPRVGESLRQEWEGARRFLDLSHAMFMVLDAEGTIVRINRRGCEILGRQEDQIVGRNWIDEFVPDRFRKEVRSVFADVMAGKRELHELYHTSVLVADGQERSVDWRNTLVRDGSGRIVGMLRYGEDFTEHRRAEEKLTDSEKRYRLLVEKMNEGVGAINEKGRITLVNDRMCQLLGYSREDLIGRPLITLYGRGNQRVMREQLARRKEGKGGQFEVAFQRKDGRAMVGLVSGTPILSSDGRFQGSIAVVMDITARREAEEALRQNELLFRRLSEANVIGVISGEGELITEANDQFLKMVGYTRSDLKAGKLDWVKMTPPEYSAATRATTQAVLSTGVFPPHQKEYIRKDGSRVPVEIGGALVSPSPFRWVCFVVDLTDRRKAGEKLAESENRYRQLVEKMNEGVAFIDANGVHTFVNDRLCQMVGYSREEMLGRSCLDLFERADRRVFREEFKRRRKGQAGQYEVTFRRKDGRAMRGLISPTPIFDADGRFQGSIAVILDITARKQAEEALRQNELFFRRLFDANVIGVISGEGGLITQANGRFLKMVGYTRADLKAGKVDWQKMTPFQYASLDRAKVHEVLTKGIVSPHHKEYIRKDGTRVPVEVGGALISASPFRWVCFVVDLTERRRAEAELQQAHDKMEERVALRTAELEAAYEDLQSSEEKYRQLFATETDAIVLMDGKTFRFIDANDSACRLFGYPREELLRITQVDASAEPDATRRAVKRSAREGRIFVPLRYLKKKDGTAFPTEISSSSFSLRGRRVVVGVIRDITERKRAEEALQVSEEKYRQLFAAETDAILIMDGETFQIIDANDSACRLYGYTREEYLRLTGLDTTGEPQASRESLRITARGKRNFVPLRFHKKKDGTLFPVEISTSSFTLRGRRMVCGVVRDVTQRRQGEQALLAARAKLLAAREEERRRLSQELHDSIGQRLVAAHMKLRNAAEIPSVARDPLFSGLLRDLLAQVGGLSAEVREVSHALYPQTLELLGLPAALRQLAKDMGPARSKVEVRIDAASADERLGPQTEIALYRIAQEALSNAIRHARCRHVELRLGPSAGGQVSLTIVDDGRGFNPAKSSGKGVGLTSMRERAESIGATFELTSRRGRTCVRVRAAQGEGE